MVDPPAGFDYVSEANTEFNTKDVKLHRIKIYAFYLY